jgi:two-component system, NtrC family, nitrogen regulation response regulator GlnG
VSAPNSVELPVVLVDDEPHLLNSTSLVLRSAGISEVITLNDSRQVLPLLGKRDVGMLVLDLNMPDLSGLKLLELVAVEHPEVPVIMMTATNDIDSAAECMRSGAVDYLVKPVERNRLVSSVRRAIETRALRAEVLSLKESLLNESPRQPQAFAEMVTQGSAMRSIFRYLEAVAPSPQPVLITGEIGTGKELVARALHRLSGRPGELVAVNVAGLGDNMFSDTLFGHSRGAYTGAGRAREGLIARAGDGTLFLDEIGDLTVASQIKLLRVLQDGTYYPLGADQPRRNRARIVVATNIDVPGSVAKGTFRKDLYYRLRTRHLQLPPLRARPGDLRPLVHHFAEKAATALHKPIPTFPSALFQLLGTYSFPGNIRELEEMVFNALARHQGGVLSTQSFKEAMSLQSAITNADSMSEELLSGRNLWLEQELPTLAQAEEMLMREAMRRAEGNQGVAAAILGISGQALNKRLSLPGKGLSSEHDDEWRVPPESF